MRKPKVKKNMLISRLWHRNIMYIYFFLFLSRITIKCVIILSRLLPLPPPQPYENKEIWRDRGQNAITTLHVIHLSAA